MIVVQYNMPEKGLGTDFSESNRPLSFAETYTNRFRNITGGAERRAGMQRFLSRAPGGANLTRIHEYIDNQGNETLMSSDDLGNIYVFDTVSSAWSTPVIGKAPARMISIQAEDKLIFCNGIDRVFYTNDAGKTFKQLHGLISTGIAATPSSAAALYDSNITNWLGQTQVSNNDIVYNQNLNAYGIVVTISSAQLTHTTIGVSATGAGNASRDQAPGDQYQLIDFVNMEIIPAGAGFTNVATATTGTTTSVIAVSGINFANTEMRTGDFVYNTTRGALGIIGSVSANANISTPITGQTSGDALAFFKEALPIASWLHVHYGRVYYLDSRNQTRIVISAPDDATDVTTFQQTLDTSSFSFGQLQPAGDAIQSMTTFQSFFVASGQKNLYIYKGVNPILDKSTSISDFTAIAFYPNGVATPYGLGTNGTDLLHVTGEGLQAINIGTITNTTIQNNVSVPIRNTLKELISVTSAQNIQMSFYPRRSWLIVKVGDSCYVLNSNPSYTDAGEQIAPNSWHLFSGKWAQQNHYFVRRNGDLLACGQDGIIYEMDSSAAVTDDGNTISTDLVMSWLRLEEPQKTIRVKQGYYIKPLFESDPSISYTINVIAGWDNLSSDSISTSAVGGGTIGSFVIGTSQIGAGAFVEQDKYPLRWRGEQARLEFISNSSAAPDIITGFIIYGDIGGIR